MANVLKDALVAGRAAFYVRCFVATLWVAGFTVICWVDWRLAVGAFLLGWAAALQK